MDSKTYRPKNLKFLLSLVFLFILTVSILLYLLSLRNFTPLDINNSYNWNNILTFSALLFTSIFSFTTAISYIILRLIFRKDESRVLKIVCVKWGLMFTIGIFVVIFLNFFHILNIYWGLGILLVVIFLSFVI